MLAGCTEMFDICHCVGDGYGCLVEVDIDIIYVPGCFVVKIGFVVIFLDAMFAWSRSWLRCLLPFRAVPISSICMIFGVERRFS